MYQELFGKDRIKIMLFEDFIKDRERYARELCRYFGVSEGTGLNTLRSGHSNPRGTTSFLRYNQLRNIIFPGIPLRDYIPFGDTLRKKFESYIRKGRPAHVVIPQKWREELAEIYKYGNRKIASDYDLPLEQHGYPF